MSVAHSQNDQKQASNTTRLLIDLWKRLAKSRQRQLVLVFCLMLASAFAEVVSLGAVLPFIGVLTAPEKVLSHASLKRPVEALGIQSPQEVVLPVVILFMMTAVFAGILRLTLLWATAKLSNAIGADLSLEMYRRTLYQPYKVHFLRNSSEVIDGITHKSWAAMDMLKSTMTFVSSFLLMTTMVAGLVVIDPAVVSGALAVFGLIYGVVALKARRKLRENSQRISEQGTLAIKSLQEGLGSIREILLNWSQAAYCETYRKADMPYRMAYGSNLFISVSPRFAMETIGMVLITSLAYFLSTQHGGIGSSLPLLGALALGAQRIIPALQQIYWAWASIAGNRASLEEVIDLLNQPIPGEALKPPPETLDFHDHITFNGVWFRYLDTEPWVLKDLNLVIPRGCRMGFVGGTGSGKSTTLDLLMGLLEPTQGRIMVDGREIRTGFLRAWQQNIAHVPQSIFLADSTLAENIALGEPLELIDMKRVRQAAKQAMISDFIESRPEGYNALVGERGVMLSGGQRQRIGIARALYKEASVLVLDEATSSLDNQTEKAVMACIENLDRDLTILIIAHRLTTIQNCERIVELAEGRVTAEGTYDELVKKSPSFRLMATYRASALEKHEYLERK